MPGGRRPIIDLANQSLLSGLADFSEVKIIASFERIQVSPSHRAFAIQRSRTLMPPFRVLEVFAGGGTLTAALTGNPSFQVAAGVEIEPDFADEWQAQHPESTLVQSDIRALHPSELPEFDGLIGGCRRQDVEHWRRSAKRASPSLALHQIPAILNKSAAFRRKRVRQQ